jgi:hypothetical protein
MGWVFRGWVLRSRRSGRNASSASTNVVQDAGYCGARYFGEFVRAQKILKVLRAVVTNGQASEIQGNVHVVWELPKRGLTRWVEDSRMKEGLDLSGGRILRVERQVEEDTFTGKFVLFG